MTHLKDSPIGWRDVMEIILERIHSRQWQQGEPIPGEAKLAEELGCARSTMNRALQEIAAMGLIERRRKAGSFVTKTPVRRAVLEIPIIRKEIEALNKTYNYALIHIALKENDAPQGFPCFRGSALHILCLHSGDSRPFALEERLIYLETIPFARDVDFSKISPNEWLVRNIPFESAAIEFSSIAATARMAEYLDCHEGEALFSLNRNTYKNSSPLSSAMIFFAPGYRLRTSIEA